MLVNFDEADYSYDKLKSDASELSKQYDSILQCVTIGRSHDNRDIILLKLGLGKKYMICCSGVHGRETINPIVLMRIVEYYADLYVNHKETKQNLKHMLLNSSQHLGAEYEKMLLGACIYELLQTFTILFIPLLNPDGYMISLNGFDSINNPELKSKCLAMKLPHQDWKANARGVDINRNFPSRLWKPKNLEDYAASENETQALISVFHHYRSKGFLDFHSRGKQIYYYRKEMINRYNERQLLIANRLIKHTNYELVPPDLEIDPGDSGGNTVHYFSEHFNKPALTIETVDEEASFPLDIAYREPTFHELRMVILEFGSLII